MNLLPLAESLDTPGNPLRQRQVTGVSVEDDQTCTIDAAGTQISGVKYTVPPRPGGSCWVTTDGSDLMVTHTLVGQSVHPAAAGKRVASQSMLA